MELMGGLRTLLCYYDTELGKELKSRLGGGGVICVMSPLNYPQKQQRQVAATVMPESINPLTLPALNLTLLHLHLRLCGFDVVLINIEVAVVSV